MKNLELAKKHEEYIVSMRRYLHEHPELSDHEDETCKKISEELTAMGIENVEIPHGGVLGKIVGGKDTGKAVLLRADCDALPVIEKDINLSCKRTCVSKNEGVMHACGHDGHVSMLLGAAKILLDRKDELEGTVYLCFERGEEGTGNVKYIFKYIEDNDIHIDAVYGTHVWSDLEAGKLCINDSDMMAGVMAFDVTIEGRGGHGSRPDQSNSPIDCFVAIYHRLEAIRLTKVNPFKTCAYSVGKLEAGIRNNVIPQSLSFGGTMRTFDPFGAGMEFYNEFKKAIDGICAAYDCVPTYNRFSKPRLPVVNNPEVAVFARKVIGEEIGAENVVQHEPWMASESFGRYMMQWPGVFAFLGINNPEKGTGAAHHNQNFDIDEDVLHLGSTAAATYAIEYLKSDMPANGRLMSYHDLLVKTEDTDTLKELYGE